MFTEQISFHKYELCSFKGSVITILGVFFFVFFKLVTNYGLYYFAPFFFAFHVHLLYYKNCYSFIGF